MAKKKKPWWHGKKCAYCENVADSEDHVPPRSLYRKGTPDLIKVPSCGDCRKKYAMHDELFKTILVQAIREGNPVTHEHFLGTVGRAMKRLVGLGPKIARQTVDFDLVTESGIYSGQKLQAIKITDEDWKRIKIVLIRIVRGLYYHLNEGKKRYDDYLYLVVDFDSQDGEKILKNNKFMEAFKAAKAINIVDGNVCKAKIIPIKGVENTHIWLLEFYDQKRFYISANTRERALEITKGKHEKFISPSGILLRPN